MKLGPCHFFFKVKNLEMLYPFFPNICIRNISSSIWIYVPWGNGILPYDILYDIIPRFEQISYGYPFLYHMKLLAINLHKPDGHPVFNIGWTSEILLDLARTRLAPVSQSVNRLKCEFFLAEKLTVCNRPLSYLPHHTI